MTSRGLLLIYLVICFSGSHLALGQGVSCKTLKLCDVDKDNPICTLLRPSGQPETPQSIRIFLSELSSLDDAMRQDMICARLIGRRTINLRTEINYVHESVPLGEVPRYIFNVVDAQLKKNRYIWHLKMPREYIRLVAAHRELDRLNRPASKGMTLQFEGMIFDVAAYYDQTWPHDETSKKYLSGVRIKIDSVVPLQITTPYSTGRISGQTQAIQELIRNAYGEYMTTGLTQQNSDDEEYYKTCKGGLVISGTPDTGMRVTECKKND